MNRVHRYRRGAQRGQVIIFLAITLLVILSMMTLAVDGSYGLVQERQDQNAADFASLSVADALRSYCTDPSTTSSVPTYDDLWSMVSQEVASNGTNLDATKEKLILTDGNSPPTTLATVTDPSGVPGSETAKLAGGAVVPNTSSVPPTACADSVTAPSSWHTFMGGVIGQNNANTGESATASAKPLTNVFGSIYSLDLNEPHVVLAGGQGAFTVSGPNATIFLSTTTNQWSNDYTGSDSKTYEFDDAIDAKENGNVSVWGTIYGTNQKDGSGYPRFPLDPCFEPGGAPVSSIAGVPPTTSDPQPNPPANTNKTVVARTCGSEDINYNQIDTTSFTPSGDPLNGGGGSGGVTVPDPTDTAIANHSSGAGFAGCTTPTPTFNAAQASTMLSAGTPHLMPGIYTQPVDITTGAQLWDCSNSLDTSTPPVGYPGIYVFEKGLHIDVPAGKTVTGYNVMMATGTSLPEPGNVPGTLSGGVFTPSGVPGNGAPCLVAGITGPDNGGKQTAETNGTPCAGGGGLQQTATYGNSPPSGGTGMNYSLMIGGQGTVQFQPPTTGAWQGVLLFQHRSDPGNWGFNASPNDSANITLNGLVYNASLPGNGCPAGVCTPVWWWDPTGIMPGSGGIMQTGYGIPSGAGWAPSSGSVTVNGVCVVETFSTYGKT